MIDCHVHLFPPAADHARPLAAAVEKASGGRVATERLEPWLRAAADLGAGAGAWVLRRARDAGVTLTARRADRARARVPSALRAVVDTAAALAAAPGVFVAGGRTDLLHSMDRLGISRAVVIASPPLAPPEWLLDTSRAAGDRLVPVVTLPRADGARCAEALDALAARGARGVKLHAAFDGGAPAAWRAAFEVARRRRLFVVVHTGRFDVPGLGAGATDPAALVPLLAAFPEVPVCLAHMNRDAPEAAWEVMARHENAWADTSWQPPEAIAAAIRRVGPDRLLLGSDWPLLHGDLQAEAVDALRRGAPGHLDAIARVNPRRFLAER